MKWVAMLRPSPSMAVALTALVLAASGTAVAATNLVSGDKLIKKNSLSANRLRNHSVTARQINLRKLGKVPSARTADSATTATNAAHASAADSATFAASAIATGQGTLASGRTEVGVFAGRGTDAMQDIPISFPIPLASAPTPHVVAPGATAAGCTGSVASPTAAPGVVCVYERVNTVGTAGTPVDPVTPTTDAASRFGLFIFLSGTENHDNVEYGTWAVTAP